MTGQLISFLGLRESISIKKGEGKEKGIKAQPAKP